MQICTSFNNVFRILLADLVPSPNLCSVSAACLSLVIMSVILVVSSESAIVMVGPDGVHLAAVVISIRIQLNITSAALKAVQRS